VLRLTQAAGLEITNVDLTVIAQVPKLAPWREQIRRNVCRLLALDAMAVNVKATTEEKLGFTGEKKGLKAVATVTGLRPVHPVHPVHPVCPDRPDRSDRPDCTDRAANSTDCAPPADGDEADNA
jgi:2-C-methyl-D-erythritol 4-phosphate cytidylyltransferase/2-C-methyl-D-erythritol 2,4-cyclodiphosphate synthase